jgi:acyl-CoA synthetase (AMP-forming)/AMP-acid ligase II
MKALGTITLGSYLTSSALRFGDREAVVDPDRGIRRNYRELGLRARSVANALLERGIKKGDFVAFLAYNCAEFIEVYFALAKIGAIIAPQVYRLSAREIKELVHHCEAKAFIFAQEFGPIVDEIRSDLPTVGLYVGLGKELPAYATSYEAMATGYPSAEPPVAVTEEDPQYLNYTSGTTGLPKAYLLSHYNNSVALPFVFEEFQVTADDTVLTVFPMYGRVGFAWTAMCVFKGARHVVLNFRPDRFLETVQKEKVTMVNLVPTMAQMLLQHPDLDRYDLSSLRGIVFAGAPLPQTVYESTRERLCPNVYEYYGLQETGIITSLGPVMKHRKPGSVGMVAPGVDMRLVDDEGRDVPPGEIGEVIIRSPGATTGYYRQPDKTAAVIRDGWFCTGDLGRLDEDSFLYVVGRKKDMIISGGQNIFAPEVEETILAHPAVADCAVIGLPHDLWGEGVTAVVTLREGAAASADEIIGFCKERIAHFKAPKAVHFASSIPRNPAGKAMKFMLADEYASTFKGKAAG